VAVAKKQKKQEAGAPSWMVTYGDMVTLLLTFFVLLLSMSELKKEERLMQFMEAIKQAFGYQGGFRFTPLDEPNDPKNVPLAQMIVIPVHTKDFSKSSEEGVKGTRDKVRPVRDADLYAVAGPIKFQELSADLSAEEQAAVAHFAETLRGYATQIHVRGHCNPRPVRGTRFSDHLELAYTRARNVRDLLVEHGIDGRRIIVTAMGTNEPLATQAYRDAERMKNDIVELLQKHVAVQELYEDANVNQ
jgi:chemotaxis protein MotB